jgi:hypothetical protein
VRQLQLQRRPDGLQSYLWRELLHRLALLLLPLHQPASDCIWQACNSLCTS